MRFSAMHLIFPDQSTIAQVGVSQKSYALNPICFQQFDNTATIFETIHHVQSTRGLSFNGSQPCSPNTGNDAYDI